MTGPAEALRMTVQVLTEASRDGAFTQAQADQIEREARAALAAHDAAVQAGGWREDFGLRVTFDTDGRAEDVTEIVSADSSETLCYSVPDRAARIVACVNACQGIADPARLVAAARGVLGHGDASTQTFVTVPAEAWRELAGAFCEVQS